MEENKKVMRVGNPDDAKKLAVSSIQMIPTPVGVMASTGGNFGAAAIAASSAYAGSLISKLIAEYSKLMDNHKIKDIESISSARSSFVDLLKYAGQELPDEEKWNVLKFLFLKQISIDTSSHDELMSYLLMDKVKQLTPAELVIVLKGYKARKNFITDASMGVLSPSSWSNALTSEIGLIPELVLSSCSHLSDLGFINMITHASGTTIFINNEHRGFTQLTAKLFEIVSEEEKVSGTILLKTTVHLIFTERSPWNINVVKYLIC